MKITSRVGWVFGMALLSVQGSVAHAELLHSGVYMLTQDVGWMGGNAIWQASTLTSMDYYAGGTDARADYLNGKTTFRRGFDYGLMGEVSLSYQWNMVNEGQYPYAAGAVRGGLQYARFGVYKSLTSISPNASASFLPDSPMGDLEVFGGVSVPLRKRDKFDFFTPYEGTFKADLGLHHVYYTSLLNTDFAVGGSYRSGFPWQAFAQFGAQFHWEECPVEWFQHSYLKPYVQYLYTFKGFEGSVTPDYLTEWTKDGYAPVQKTHVEVLAAGVEFMHPWNYTFFTAVHYSRSFYGKNTLRFDEAGVTLNYLF